MIIFITRKKLDYEKDKMEYKYLDEVEAALEAQKKKGNIVDEYTFLVEKSREDIILKLNVLKQKFSYMTLAILNSGLSVHLHLISIYTNL